MTGKREVEMTVLRRGRREDRMRVYVDTDEADDMRDQLINWLEEGQWDSGLWPDFEATFYGSKMRTVRAVPLWRDIGSGLAAPPGRKVVPRWCTSA